MFLIRRNSGIKIIKGKEYIKEIIVFETTALNEQPVQFLGTIETYD